MQARQTENSARITIVLRGRVQGVLLRRGIKAEALRLGLSGFTENRADGTVHVVAEGDQKNVQKLLDWCYNGSAFSKIEGLEFTWQPPEHAENTFRILRRGDYIADKFAAIEQLSKKVFGTSAQSLVLPKHVAVIPDGNRRWAKERNISTFIGHTRGMENSIDLFSEAHRLGIPYFTLWGFSTENWNRSQQEVNFLMRIFKNYVQKVRHKLFEKKVRFLHFGRRDRLPKNLVQKLESLQEETAHFTKGNLGLALDYGGRDELIRAIKKLPREGEISEAAIQGALDTGSFPDPDFIIRTSGEQRLSGFMPWQGTYAELYFAKENFPAFGVKEFREALTDFSQRKRNFGA